LVDARRDGLWMHYRLTEMANPIFCGRSVTPSRMR
jgi:hypothetical protein